MIVKLDAEILRDLAHYEGVTYYGRYRGRGGFDGVAITGSWEGLFRVAMALAQENSYAPPPTHFDAIGTDVLAGWSERRLVDGWESIPGDNDQEGDDRG